MKYDKDLKRIYSEDIAKQALCKKGVSIDEVIYIGSLISMGRGFKDCDLYLHSSNNTYGNLFTVVWQYEDTTCSRSCMAIEQTYNEEIHYVITNISEDDLNRKIETIKLLG